VTKRCQIPPWSANVAAAVEEQGKSTDEIARTVERTAVGTQAMTVAIGSVAGSTAETGTAADHVLGSSADVSRQSEQLSREVDLLVVGIRAA
jgi:hypothetical protein